MEAQGGGASGVSYNPAAVVAQADQIVMQLQQMDPGSKQSYLSHLSQEDPVMYAVVKDRLDTQRTMQRQQAAAQIR